MRLILLSQLLVDDFRETGEARTPACCGGCGRFAELLFNFIECSTLRDKRLNLCSAFLYGGKTLFDLGLVVHVAVARNKGIGVKRENRRYSVNPALR